MHLNVEDILEGWEGERREVTARSSLPQDDLVTNLYSSFICAGDQERFFHRASVIVNWHCLRMDMFSLLNFA